MNEKVLILSTACLSLLLVTLMLPATLAFQANVTIVDLAAIVPSLKFNGSPAWGFRPVVTTVQAGGTVTFTNTGLDPHTVTSFSLRAPVEVLPGVVVNFPVPDGHFNSGIMSPGDTFAVSTASLSPGTYTIFCELHPWMQGAIIVSTSGPTEASTEVTDPIKFTGKYPFPGSATWGFLPRTVTVAQGTAVVFTHKGLIPHTVTSGVPGQPGAGTEFNSGFAPPSWLIFGTTFTVDTSTLSPGNHPYFCALHSWMQGTIRVQA